METENKNNIAALEALLFIHGEAIARNKIMSILKLKEAELSVALEGLKSDLESETRGLSLLINGEKVQLVTKAEFGSIMAEFVKAELQEDLTPAALEALSLILYLGPIQRVKLDYLRGVNSSFIVRNLMLRGLVERIPDPLKSSLSLYRATPEALRHLGISSASELPEFEKFRSMVAPEGMGETRSE